MTQSAWMPGDEGGLSQSINTKSEDLPQLSGTQMRARDARPDRVRRRAAGAKA